MSLGMVQQLPPEDQSSKTKREILAMIDVMMGGRVAEEVLSLAAKSL
jgi:ATP-dependent metalloprotease